VAKFKGELDFTVKRKNESNKKYIEIKMKPIKRGGGKS